MRFSHPRPFLALLAAWGFVLLFSSSAGAQVLRPSESLYVQLRGGVSAYFGDLDDSEGFGNPGVGAGAEIGYLFNPNVSFGLGFMYHDLPIREGIRYDDQTDTFVPQEQSGLAYQLQGLFRYSPFTGRIAPFMEAGGALVWGRGTEAGRNNGSTDDDVLGYGPVAGLGVDIALTPQLGFLLGGQGTFVFPDVALDNADPGAFGNDGDDADYDAIGTLYGGLRYAFRSPYTPAEITRLTCPGTVTSGESASFMAATNSDATPPVSVSWTWGDGSTGAGMNATHTYRTPGTYTVTATASGSRSTDSETCVVTVEEPQIAPTLSACRVSPAQVGPGESVTLNGTVNSDASQPVELTVEWGDGDVEEGTTLPTSHSFNAPGTYTVITSASNAYGASFCETQITVVDTFCSSVSEFNSVYFEFGSPALTADARERLDENLSTLQRCPDLCVLIQAYTDDRETDQLRLSQARANAIRDYYIANGVDAGRLRAVGLGEDPSANSKEDPGPGDSRARRGDSIPAACGTFTPTGRSRR